MKKLSSLFLALALTLSLAAVPAQAAEALTRGEFLVALFERSGDADTQAHQAYFTDVPSDGRWRRRCAGRWTPTSSRGTATADSARTIP